MLFELSSAKKRTTALSRFSHNAKTLVSKSVHTKMIMDFSELNESDKTVYMISWDKNDGMLVPLEDAIAYCKNTIYIGDTDWKSIFTYQRGSRNRKAESFLFESDTLKHPPF